MKKKLDAEVYSLGQAGRGEVLVGLKGYDAARMEHVEIEVAVPAEDQPRIGDKGTITVEFG